MDIIREFTEHLLRALGRMALNPFYYIGIAFIALQYRRQIILERKFFSSRLHSLPREVLRTMGWGLLAGLVASLLMASTGMKMVPQTVLLLWVITLALMFLRVRFLCLAYAAGVLGILRMIVIHIPSYDKATGLLGWLSDAVMGADLPSLFTLVAVLHLLEGTLILIQGQRLASPLFVESKRGRIVGAYHLQGFWPVPLFLLAPLSGGTLKPVWEPLFSGNWQVLSGWDFLVFPAVIGFSQMTISVLPKAKLRQGAGLILIYGTVLLVGSVVTFYWSPFGWGLSVCSILLLEAIVWYGARAERHRTPLFINGKNGLKIFAILPGSAAEAIGLVVGESLYKVNGERVQTNEELHLALRLNSAFCKLEVINLEGESKFASHALFEDQHHQLGMVLSPDEKTLFYLEERPFPFSSYVRRKWMGVIHSKRGADLGSGGR
ncbi:MAG: PDZ domain-containing protein [Gorillibacterium sp.]|nr:PDZ domain-containing protein [Gorillibacterium sp.]